MKDRPPPDSSEYTKWLKEKANLELTIADARMRKPAYERHSIISQIPSSLSLRRVGLTLFKNNIYRPPEFSPSSIPGLGLWLDAADKEALTLSGSMVTTWRDKSGRGNNMVSVSGYQIPNYNISGMNGLPTVSFFRTSSSSFSVLQNTAFSGLTGKSFTFLMVAKRSTGSGTISIPRFLSAAITTNGEDISDIGAFDISAAFPNRFGIRRNNDITSGTGPFNTENVFLGGVIVNGTATGVGNFASNRSYAYANGAQISTTNSVGAGNDFNVSHVRLGAATQSPETNDGDSGTLQGNISEIILFNRVLTTSEFTSVEGYLAWKWGLQNSLPSSHPYFSAKPELT